MHEQIESNKEKSFDIKCVKKYEKKKIIITGELQKINRKNSRVLSENGLIWTHPKIKCF